MAKRREQEISCETEFTEGARQRLADAFTELYYGMKNGIYKCPEPEQETP